MPTVIICSAQHWTAPIHLSAHHIADFLVSKGWRVCFLSTPTSILHRLRFAGDRVVRERFNIWRRGGGYDHDGRLFYYTPLALLPPSRLPILNRPWIFNNWPRFTMPRLQEILAAKGFGEPDLMILDSSTMAPLWRSLGHPRLFYRVTDNNKNYPDMPPMVTEFEEYLAHEAEIVIYTGSALAPYVESLAPRVSLCVANGVDVAHFSQAQELPEDYRNIPAPRAVYIGTIAQWFDEELIAKAARFCPGVSFVIIGPGAQTLEKLRDIDNVYLLGSKPYAQVPAYMQHAHVGLIPFQTKGIEAFVDDINPLKLYEYMATGLPVVSTPIQQVNMLKSPAIVAADEEGFCQSVREVCTTRSDGENERRFALRFDWSNQFSALADYLETPAVT